MDIKGLEAGDIPILTLSCVMCSSPVTDLNNPLISCQHVSCDVYVCEKCLLESKVQNAARAGANFLSAHAAGENVTPASR